MTSCRSAKWVLLVGAVSLSLAQASSATLIFGGTTLFGPTAVASNQVDVQYDAAADLFTALGTAGAITTDGLTQYGISGGSFDLSATIDESGILSGGMLTITGTVAALGFNSGTLLVGDVVGFGFPNAGGDPLEFLISVTGGDAPFMSQAGAILSFTSFPGDFGNDFNNNRFVGLSDTKDIIPEPTTALLLGFGLVALAHRRSRTL